MHDSGMIFALNDVYIFNIYPQCGFITCMFIDPATGFHMWFVLFLTVGAVGFFVWEKYSLEVTSVALLTILLLFGQFFPFYDMEANNLLNAQSLLAGFANPSLVAVLALLVMGQAMIQTDALRSLSQFFVTSNRRLAWMSIFCIMVSVAAVSAFMNNTPLVVIAIPVMQALVAAIGVSESRVMIPLSYAAILGGMTTIIGSSTNLLVSSTMTELGYEPLNFFAFTVPGLMLAGVGLVYVLFIAPRLLSDRTSMTNQLVGNDREFIAEIDVNRDSPLIGQVFEEGKFSKLAEMNIRLIQRSGHLILPPFEGYAIEAGDIIIVAATRESLAKMLAQHPGFLLSEDEEKVIEGDAAKEELIEPESTARPQDDIERQISETRQLAEIMIAPASRLVDMTLDQVGFHRQFSTIVLGIQRRARVVRRRLGRIRLEPGDVLLVAGSRAAINGLRDNTDLVVLSGSKRDLPLPKKAPTAVLIFLAVVLLAAFGVLSIPVAAITGAVAMLSSGCLNVRQAIRAIDRKIFLLVGSMLALGTAMQETQGASYIAQQLLHLPMFDTPLMMAGLLFILVAITTNVLTNNACAILFTPIALNLAVQVGVDPIIFAITVIFAANCSFASPIGYQTNLMVMGPGHYRFSDFLKAGIPLVILIWGAYILLAKYYFGLQ